MTGKPDRTTAHNVCVTGGFLLLGLVAFSPWPFGSVDPDWQLIVSLWLFVLVSLWSFHAAYTSRLSYTPDIASSCLLGLVFLTAGQLIPLPEQFVRILSPATVERHRNLLPEVTEILPGDSELAPIPRSRWVRLSASPANTLDMLAELLAVFLVYAAARNFVAIPSPKDSLRQLTWVAFATGTGLALLALLQTLSGDHTRVLWMFPVGTRPYGPFVNKNHFAFQINIFMGLTGGLFVTVAHQRGWRSPLGLGLLGGLGLMVTALAFSESRGGMIAALAAAGVVGALSWCRGRNKQQHQSETQAGLALALGIIVVAGGLIAWLGVNTVVDRIATLWGGNADNRSADWRSVWPLVERYPLTGVGAGALTIAEPSVRTRSDITYVFNTLDNEYLEALVEGGIVRLMLTLGLGLSAVLVCLRGYRRTGDPLLLGCAYGLIAVGFQSAGDFGLHTTSVAITASVVVAFATARGRKPEPGRHRSGDDGPRRGEWVFKDGYAYFAAALLFLAGAALVLAEWRNYRASEYREAASILLRSGLPESRDDAIRLLEVATRIRSDDPAAWELLMVSHLAAAVDQHQRATSAVTGCIVFVDPADMLPTGDPGGHLAATLRAARNLRDRQNLSPAAHLMLGRFANQFAHSEPAAAHFARAKSIAGYDPDVWYQCGRGAANQGDWTAAASDWHESLIRSRKRLAPIVWHARSHLSPEELRVQVLPNDPEVWLAATPFAFGANDDAGRSAWFRAIADRCATTEPTSLKGFVAWSTALEKLGDTGMSLSVWRRAVECYPDEVLARDKFADALMDGEYYEEAIPVLEWLITKQPERNEYRDRLTAAQHALKLKAEINAP